MCIYEELEAGRWVAWEDRESASLSGEGATKAGIANGVPVDSRDWQLGMITGGVLSTTS
jgi:hypothetical protein